MNKTLRLIFGVIFLFGAVEISAQTTGKIAGKIEDQETGEALIGVNIMLEGTMMGTASDLNGNYFINNVPPGKYTLVASSIGYQKRIIENVQVSVDYTTRIDVKLSTDVITVQTVVVQAVAPMVRKDQTSSRTTLDAGQIATLPVENLTQILSLQAGVTQGVDGALHIRGGRSSEIAYTINGVSINNPYDNSRSVQISSNAIQELSVVSGTFNAEYGNALSGIVNTVTKEGGNDYKGNVSFYTGDKMSTRTGTFFNVDDINIINNYVGEFTFGGPIPLTAKSVFFFFSGRYDNNGGWLYGQRKHTIYDSVYKNPLNPNDIRISSSGDNKIVSMNPSEDLNLTGKLTYKPIPTIKINYDVLYSNSEYKSYSHTYKYNPDALGTNYEWGLLNAFEFRHAISNSVFYSLKGSYNFNDYKNYLFPLLDENGNAVSFYPGMDMTNLHADDRYQPDHKNVLPANYTFYVGGTAKGHSYQRTKTSSAKFDITGQVNINHEVKAGAELKVHVLDYENFTIMRDTVTYKTPTILGTNTTNHNLYTRKPYEFSAYIQDKMEFESIVINLGLRYDLFSSEARYSTDITYPSPNKTGIPSYIDKSSLLAYAEQKHQLSPRVGISFPITDKGIIHFSYGHFHQIPPFRYLYTNPDFKYDYSSGTPTFGNANLNPEQTVAYEIGLQQQIAEDIAFNATGFYKDVRDLLALQQIRTSSTETYYKYVNQDYANIKGFTFSLTKRRTAQDLIGASIDYTFQVAEGNETNTDAFFLDLSSGRQSEKIPVYLAWDKAHSLNGTITFGQPSNWNVTLVGKYSTGLPYTPLMMTKNMTLRTNTGRRPSFLSFDLLADKTFPIFNTFITVFIKVFNLFDFLNERYIYTDSGRSTYTLEQFLGPAQNTDELAMLIDGIEPVSDYFNRPNYYYSPREVRVGFSLGF